MTLTLCFPESNCFIVGSFPKLFQVSKKNCIQNNKMRHRLTLSYDLVHTAQLPGHSLTETHEKPRRSPQRQRTTLIKPITTHAPALRYSFPLAAKEALLHIKRNAKWHSLYSDSCAPV